MQQTGDLILDNLECEVEAAADVVEGASGVEEGAAVGDEGLQLAELLARARGRVIEPGEDAGLDDLRGCASALCRLTCPCGQLHHAAAETVPTIKRATYLCNTLAVFAVARKVVRVAAVAAGAEGVLLAVDGAGGDALLELGERQAVVLVPLRLCKGRVRRGGRRGGRCGGRCGENKRREEDGEGGSEGTAHRVLCVWFRYFRCGCYCCRRAL